MDSEHSAVRVVVQLARGPIQHEVKCSEKMIRRGGRLCEYFRGAPESKPWPLGTCQRPKAVPIRRSPAARTLANSLISTTQKLISNRFRKEG